MSEADRDARAVLSRRSFLAASAGLWIQAALPRPLAAAAAAGDSIPQALSASEWALVEAITARILPTDDLPGAVEANCVNFIDKALAHEDAAALPAYRAALRELDRVCRARRSAGEVGEVGEVGVVGEGRSFSALPAQEQDAILSALEEGRLEGWRAAGGDQATFFATIRIHTILGFVLDPRHGGNRDYAGWRVMGYPGPPHHLGGARPEHLLGGERFVPIWEREGGSGPGSGHG